MSKGSSPRNNHSTRFRDNYDDIVWNRSECRKEIQEWAESMTDGMRNESSEVLMGKIRQSTNNPINKDTEQSCASEENSL